MSPRKKSAGKNKTDEIFIPDKLYFRIGEVATLCRLPAYVLRFWESEFPQLKPVKSSTGQRMYRRRDVESVLRIKQLLYEQGFTIVGARQQLRSETKTEKGQAAIPFPAQSSAEMQRIRQFYHHHMKFRNRAQSEPGHVDIRLHIKWHHHHRHQQHKSVLQGEWRRRNRPWPRQLSSPQLRSRD